MSSEKSFLDACFSNEGTILPFLADFDGEFCPPFDEVVAVSSGIVAKILFDMFLFDSACATSAIMFLVLGLNRGV